jgi:hypothetical protein
MRIRTARRFNRNTALRCNSMAEAIRMTTKGRGIRHKGAVSALAVLALGIPAVSQNFVTKAPTPADWTAIAKLPDFNGVWERGGGGAGGARGGGRGGLQLAPAYAEKRAAYRANPPDDNPSANCLPPGMPGIMTQPYPMEFLMTPGKVTIVIEAYTQVRHIYTDGRPMPEDPDPKFFGTSIGHWEGETLVVETIGFSPSTTLEPGVPHGDKMKIVERFRLTDPNTMTIETTLTDPEALTAPSRPRESPPPSTCPSTRLVTIPTCGYIKRSFTVH